MHGYGRCGRSSWAICLVRTAHLVGTKQWRVECQKGNKAHHGDRKTRWGAKKKKNQFMDSASNALPCSAADYTRWLMAQSPRREERAFRAKVTRLLLSVQQCRRCFENRRGKRAPTRAVVARTAGTRVLHGRNAVQVSMGDAARPPHGLSQPGDSCSAGAFTHERAQHTHGEGTPAWSLRGYAGV